jgi:hypothetical protein
MLREPMLAAMIAAAGALCASPVQASDDSAIEECVDLGTDRALRHNGAQFLYVRDGADHYRVGFSRGKCNPMTTTSKLSLVTEGTDGRLCPTGTSLRVRGISCEVNRVERISGEVYAKRLRRR